MIVEEPHYLSAVEPGLLENSLPGTEGLIEILLRDAKQGEEEYLIYQIRDWAISNKDRGFPALADKFSQDIENVQRAIDIFLDRKDEFCSQQNLPPDRHPQLYLYFLYDCLLHCKTLDENGKSELGYLCAPQQKEEYFGLTELIEDDFKKRMIYNYVLVANDDDPSKYEFRIGSKERHHSALADGKALPAAGEISAAQDGDEILLFINHMTGHYRIPFSAMKAVRKSLNMPVNCQVILCDDYLLDRLKKLMAPPGGKHEP